MYERFLHNIINGLYFSDYSGRWYWVGIKWKYREKLIWFKFASCSWIMPKQGAEFKWVQSVRIRDTTRPRKAGGSSSQSGTASGCWTRCAPWSCWSTVTTGPVPTSSSSYELSMRTASFTCRSGWPRRALEGSDERPDARQPDAARRDALPHVSAGLRHIHECGMIHLDIKPANLLITQEGLSWVRLVLVSTWFTSIVCDLQEVSILYLLQSDVASVSIRTTWRTWSSPSTPPPRTTWRTDPRGSWTIAASGCALRGSLKHLVGQ
jgi:hypothetical protein